MIIQIKDTVEDTVWYDYLIQEEYASIEELDKLNSGTIFRFVFTNYVSKKMLIV